MSTNEEFINSLPKWLQNLFAIIGAVFFLYIPIEAYIESHALNADPRYTIGYVTGTDYVVGPSSHSVAFFTYAVGDSTYRSSSDGDLAAGCTRCLVKFAAADPTNKEFFNKVCVPDSITKAPALGWAAPPFPVPEQVAARLDGVRRNQLDTLAFANHRRYAARLTTQPYATVGPGMSPEERLWQHVAATMPYELALMTRIDPVTRSVGGAVVMVGAVQAAPVAYLAAEDLALTGLENSAALLENNGAALIAHLRAVTIRSFATGFGINAAGQGVGNYIVKHDVPQAITNINWLSAIASGVNVPLGYNALFSAGFSFTRAKGFNSIATGDISAYEFERDAVFNYAFGKVAAGIKFPNGLGGRSLTGLNNLYKTQPMNTGVGFGTYQAMLRLGPITGYGMGVGLNTGLEQGNRILVGAAKKVLSAKLKEKLPDPHKKP